MNNEEDDDKIAIAQLNEKLDFIVEILYNSFPDLLLPSLKSDYEVVENTSPLDKSILQKK